MDRSYPRQTLKRQVLGRDRAVAAMNHRPVSLAKFFHDYRRRGEPLVLATVAHTIGSTYRKAGAQMLIAPDGNAAGLLSGGCMEADLMERAYTVLESGHALTIEYDARSSDDILWGFGLGCEGAMRILMARLDADNHYQPFTHTERCRENYVAAGVALVTASNNSEHTLGSAY
jgi:xanthine dehydrogenase accessory factor